MNNQKELSLQLLSPQKKRDYRQLSFSEGNMYDFIELPKITIPIIEEPNNKYFKYVFGRLLMFIIHIALIAIFEIIFFFEIVSSYENDGFYSLINDFMKPVIREYNLLNYTEKIIFNEIFHSMINETSVALQSIKSKDKREYLNEKLKLKAWIYSIIIVLFSLLLIAINFYKKYKVKLKKIMSDNILMILFLGLYEYLFFKTIILKYIFVDSDELLYFIVQKLNKTI
jgi:hypothetical protein